MRKRNSFEYGEGKYYFTIKSHPSNITIHRKQREMAEAAFRQYKMEGKDIEWLGKWNGKTFVECSQPSVN
ncbi:MAG: hypothetical protein H6577_13145 [Lewinellaceae bacterium]|nr:hypothetical protein [Saprospiraceae bacterium]MCB9339070.1 hypothetical protein [Lewinellaceae bacterium]